MAGSHDHPSALARPLVSTLTSVLVPLSTSQTNTLRHPAFVPETNPPARLANATYCPLLLTAYRPVADVPVAVTDGSAACLAEINSVVPDVKLRANTS